MKLLLFLLLPCLALSEVGKDFSKCSQYFLNNGPPQFTPPPPGDLVKPICQCLKDNNGKVQYLYATLYNTDWKIPVYSAYVFESKITETGRCDAWYIEPQLDGDADPCMRPQGHNTAIGDNQALNRDYDNSGYDKGHLYPAQHTNNHVSMLATSTLTNAAPQDSAFNQKQWNQHEKDVITDLKYCTKAYVVTGVVPKDEYIPNNNNNRKVRVSQYYWRATCCQDNNNKFTGKGYYGPDNGVVTTSTIAALQNKLAKDYKVNEVVIFPGIPSGCN